MRDRGPHAVRGAWVSYRSLSVRDNLQIGVQHIVWGSRRNHRSGSIDRSAAGPLLVSGPTHVERSAVELVPGAIDDDNSVRLPFSGSGDLGTSPPWRR
jgi:hypothetical protein